MSIRHTNDYSDGQGHTCTEWTGPLTILKRLSWGKAPGGCTGYMLGTNPVKTCS